MVYVEDVWKEIQHVFPNTVFFGAQIINFVCETIHFPGQIFYFPSSLVGGLEHVFFFHIWVWVNTYRYIFSGMNIHLPAILGFTRYQGFDPSPYWEQ